MKHLLKLTSCFFLISFFNFFSASSQTPGTIDPSFGNNGVAIFTPGTGLDNVNAIAVLPDDRIICVGIHQMPDNDWDVAVFRLMPGGALDLSFGVNGYSFFDVAGDLDFGNCVAIQEDGKIIVGGGATISAFGDIDLFAARLNPEGTLDNTFGNGGISQLHIDGSEDLFYGVALQPDGKIVLAGQDMLGGTTLTNPVTVRLNTNGSLDTNFGDNGFVITEVNNEFNRFRDVTVLTDGSIVGAGSAGSSIGYDVIVIKYDESGTPVSTFGNQGTATFNLNTGNDVAFTIMQHPDNGRILVGGQKGSGFSATDFLLMAVKSNGTLDSTFGTNGVGSLSVGVIDVATDIAVQENGKIVLSGTSGGAGLGTNDWAVVRYNENGTVDSDFGTNGSTVSPIGSFFSTANSVGLQSDGKIVTGGVAANTNNDMAVVRYFGDDACSAPSSTITTNITSTSATFTWDSDASSFQVKYRAANEAVWHRVHVPAGQTFVTIPGLQPATKYAWTVRANCSGEWTSFAPYVKFITDPLREGFAEITEDISLYPNPSNGDFLLELNLQSIDMNEATITITNMLGQVVNTQRLQVVNGYMSHNFNFNGELSEGLYQVNVMTGNQSYSKPFLIQE